MISKRKLQINNKTKLAILLVLLFVIVATPFVYQRFRSESPTMDAPTGVPGQKISLTPATEQEKQESYDRKEESLKQEQAGRQPSGEATVTPTVVDAGQYGDNVEVRAFVPTVQEAGGTCKFVFKSGANIVEKTTPAEPDATTTRCTNLTVPVSEFPSLGSWSLTVEYTSSKSSGASASSVINLK